ncbi:helix-turn-helix transcriptional regulator [Xanthomonas sacchari]|uniref:helix-turn-helix domain-containing protein n=1 Tax=Xanthomonas sacchari TaxID=56458 RepID=UPI002250759C|nr:helix-turn-helix transcriptional regulator [Xanthomonas sacchari]
MELPDARLRFATRLREARLRAKLTQEALGVAAGLSVDVARTRINRYENGTRECDLRTAERLADALGLPLSALVAIDEDMADLVDLYANIPPLQRSLMLLQAKASFSQYRVVKKRSD